MSEHAAPEPGPDPAPSAPGEIILLTGPPGAGKSTVGRLLARQRPLAVHLHTDDFYAWIASGYVEPWRPESQHQNVTVIDAIAGVGPRPATACSRSRPTAWPRGPVRRGA